MNLLEVCKKKKRWYLVFEFVDHTILDDLELFPNGLDYQLVQKYLFQIINGIGFCHSHNVSSLNNYFTNDWLPRYQSFNLMRYLFKAWTSKVIRSELCYLDSTNFRVSWCTFSLSQHFIMKSLDHTEKLKECTVNTHIPTT